MKTQTIPKFATTILRVPHLKAVPESDLMRRRRLILGNGAHGPAAPGGIKITPPWPTAPQRSDLVKSPAAHAEAGPDVCPKRTQRLERELLELGALMLPDLYKALNRKSTVDLFGLARVGAVRIPQSVIDGRPDRLRPWLIRNVAKRAAKVASHQII